MPMRSGSGRATRRRSGSCRRARRRRRCTSRSSPIAARRSTHSTARRSLPAAGTTARRRCVRVTTRITMPRSFSARTGTTSKWCAIWRLAETREGKPQDMKVARAVGVAAVLALAALRVFAAETVVAIVGATVVHPERDGAAAVARNSTILIRGNRIERIASAKTTSVPRGATRIDGRGKWVIPGLVDGHVHFFQSGNLYTRPDVADFNAVMPYLDEAARNKARLSATFKVWLASGVTSVIDIGGAFWDFEGGAAAPPRAAAPRGAGGGGAAPL